MHSILLLDVDERPLSVQFLRNIFNSAPGFCSVRLNTPAGTPLEADFVDGQDFTIVRLNSRCEAISIQGTSDVSLRAAMILQRNLPMPLRITDTDYSFDLILQDFATLEELKAAITKSQES